MHHRTVGLDDPEAPTHLFQTRPNPPYPDSWSTLHNSSEPASIVDYGQVHPGTDTPDLYRYVGSSGMAIDISQPGLNNAKQRALYWE